MRYKLVLLAAVGLFGCSSPSTTTSSAITSRPNVPGTVFTIIFENDDGANVIQPNLPFFYSLANENGQALAYSSTTHPSLPNYIQLTSGGNGGVVNDNDPRWAPRIFTDNIADQLDNAGIKWRAYMESMGEPCKLDSEHEYSAHHNPFLYYDSMIRDRARCNDRIVDLDANFDADLAANYRFMFIVPNMCNDMHDCAREVSDRWLENIVTKIFASPGYQNGGALFVLFDEGRARVFGAKANLATIVASPNLVSRGFKSTTPFNHASYLATVEDIFGLPRMRTTENATPMSEFFTPAR